MSKRSARNKADSTIESPTGGDAAVEFVASIVQELTAVLMQDWPGELLSVVHFGSTVVPPIRYETDIDILVICETLPRTPAERRTLCQNAETLVEPLLAELEKIGHHVELSPIVKSRKQAEHFSLLYLDMVDRSTITYDPKGFAESLLAKTDVWIKASGARRIQRGDTWYWDLDPSYAPKKTVKIGF